MGTPGSGKHPSPGFAGVLFHSFHSEPKGRDELAGGRF